MAKKKTGSFFVDEVMANETPQKNAEAAVKHFIDTEVIALVHAIGHEYNGDFPTEEAIKRVVKKRVAGYNKLVKSKYPGALLGASLHLPHKIEAILFTRVNGRFRKAEERAAQRKEMTKEPVPDEV